MPHPRIAVPKPSSSSSSSSSSSCYHKRLQRLLPLFFFGSQSQADKAELEAPGRKAGAFALLLSVLTIAGLIDMWLAADVLRLSPHTACFLHGFVVALYVLENWVLVQDLLAKDANSAQAKAIERLQLEKQMLLQQILVAKTRRQEEDDPKRYHQGHPKKKRSLSLQPPLAAVEEEKGESSSSSNRPWMRDWRSCSSYLANKKEDSVEA